MNKSELVKDVLLKIGELMRAYINPPQKESILQNEFNEHIKTVSEKAFQYNKWFTVENTDQALSEWGSLLTEINMNKWLSPYSDRIKSKNSSKNVAIIMAGNIPLVGFHDFISALLTGRNVIIKLSSDDDILLPSIFDFMVKLAPELEKSVEFTRQKLNKPDAIIATGSDNTSRYFEYYFKNYPHIIRKNRSGIGVLNGLESEKELYTLGKDIFQYFGLGCRNVSKIFVPEGYNFNKFFEGIYEHSNYLTDHNKYMNNYDYHRAIYLLNKDDILDNGFVLLKRDTTMHSPVAVIHYEYYDTVSNLNEKLSAQSDQLQCIISNDKEVKKAIAIGNSQKPELWEYADGVDTMKFILELE